MSAQYRNKVLNRVRSRKDDYYFFYYLFYTSEVSVTVARGVLPRVRAGRAVFVERMLRSRSHDKCGCLSSARCGACSGRRTIEG